MKSYKQIVDYIECSSKDDQDGKVDEALGKAFELAVEARGKGKNCSVM